jgi:hypothetical protein
VPKQGAPLLDPRCRNDVRPDVGSGSKTDLGSVESPLRDQRTSVTEALQKEARLAKTGLLPDGFATSREVSSRDYPLSVLWELSHREFRRAPKFSFMLKMVLSG